MSNPTITLTGATTGLLLITDQDRLIHRIPKGALCEIVDSSNSTSFRLDLCLTNSETTLLFDTAIARDTFLAMLDTYY